MNPYSEYQESENIYIRIFESDTDEMELKWHWDEEDRLVESLEPTDWEFQFDNNLPISFNSPIFIPKDTMHRVIKGTGKLIVRIIKYLE